MCITPPNIAFTNKLSQFMHKPIVLHWQSVKHLLRYLKQTIFFGLHFHRSSSTLLQAFSDADWASSRDDKTLNREVLVFFSVITWSLGVVTNKLQLHVLQLRLNTRPLLMLLLRLHGWNPYYMSLEFPLNNLMFLGVITLAPPTCHQILSFTHAPNTWKLISLCAKHGCQQISWHSISVQPWSTSRHLHQAPFIIWVCSTSNQAQHHHFTIDPEGACQGNTSYIISA